MPNLLSYFFQKTIAISIVMTVTFVAAFGMTFPSMANTVYVGGQGNENEGKKSSHSLTACDQTEGIGEVFYDFDAIIILYVNFMYSSSYDHPNFPSALKHTEFNTHLVEAIKKNFSLCLKTSDGTDKPIFIAPPSHPHDFDCSADTMICEGTFERTTKKWAMIHNPRNLTLLVSGNYYPQQEIASGVNGFGSFYTFWYRPQVSYELARLPLGNNSSFVVLPPLTGLKTVEQSLESFYKNLTPKRTYYEAIPPSLTTIPLNSVK